MNSCLAIINYDSESVTNHRDDISKAIPVLERKLDARIEIINKTTSEGLSYSDWSNLDRHLERAANYNCLVVFGGDGAQAYAMNKLIKANLKIAFMGVSCGTMNIGQFSTPLDIVLSSSSNNIVKKTIDAIACDCSNLTTYAFIDAVITTTCVTRINNVVSQISAKDILSGRRIKAVPKQIGNERTRIVVNQKKSFVPRATIYTIAAAFTTHGLEAHVLAGGADPISCARTKWAIIDSDFPLTWADASFKDISSFSPISSAIFPLSQDDKVHVSGLLDDAYLICDGNAVEKCNEVTFSFIEGAITVLKLI